MAANETTAGAATSSSRYRCFGGVQSFHSHQAQSIGAPMRFGIFRPDGLVGPAPTLMVLAGLTCNEETFAIKAGAQRHAVEHGLVLVTPDTSPRATGFDGAATDWDFGEGASFYLDATEAPWSRRFRMESWLTSDLPDLLVAEFDVDRARVSICGHSMGGHGALTLALRHPSMFASVSALAPIAAPTTCPWGRKAFSRYLGPDETRWHEHDATALMNGAHRPYPDGILIDQGLDDRFLDEQLHPDRFVAACALAGQPLELRRHAGYDHGYYFIATFVRDHLAFHARALSRPATGLA